MSKKEHVERNANTLGPLRKKGLRKKGMDAPEGGGSTVAQIMDACNDIYS